MQVEFLAVDTPSDVAVSAARTCYFPGGIVPPEKSREWERKDDLLQGIFHRPETHRRAFHINGKKIRLPHPLPEKLPFLHFFGL